MQPKSEHHAMRYVGVQSSYHMFLCDICGRRLLFHVDPQTVEQGEECFIVLEQGDAGASHSGGSGISPGDLAMQPDRNHAVHEDRAELSEEWKKWLTEILDNMPDTFPD